ncbi:MAG: tRNA pseudouridine(38-40) synthase TruA [Lachnospiraceae bacterium]|jgi:tRNA pseudouridine38-40 synthase|nr:tRNA pseudouridine(38-40) synthase TruA [Lachnospiraceae bacterium]MCI1657932.1 tRNA pseudouridine(38-40) synthase TruA [Lachnospiraceae bacterium]
MKRIRLKVAYDGTNYCGWQIQKNRPTIEGELQKALKSLLGQDVRLTGASRTDAGVHSQGNIAVFDTEAKMPADKYAVALNQRLPEDIAVTDSCCVPGDWHPRHCESVKTYEYRILNRRYPDPNRRLNTYFYYHPLDLEAMRQAAAALEGTHDFRSFCSVHAQVETTVRTLYSCRVDRREDVVTIRVSGSGFLYNMVRIIAGTLIRVGSGQMAADAVPGILAACDREKAGPTAPPQGLTMIGIDYPQEAEE